MGKINLKELFADKGFDRLCIPKIQRDYVQGRLDSHTTELRENFLDDIESFLSKEGKETYYLDYVFGGKTEEGILYLVDGQQRLTTLFLLYWYFAVFENKQGDIKEWAMKKDGHSKLAYETRDSSRNFCDAILEKIMDFSAETMKKEWESNKDKWSISGYIRDQKWFQYHWNGDSTIKGMLVMLDSVFEKFGFGTNHYYKLDKFVFECLDLGGSNPEYNINDASELYIKMNARGRKLSRFENLKADLIDYYEKRAGKWPGYPNFAKKIDLDWTDAVWNTIKEKDSKTVAETVDNRLLALINAVAVNGYALSEDKNKDNKLIEWFKQKEPYIKYTEYRKLFLYGSLEKEKGYAGLLDVLYAFFEYMIKDGKFYDRLNTIYYNEKEIREQILEKGNEVAIHIDRLKFFSYYWFLYLFRVKMSDEIEFNKNLKEWMRFVCNLINNSEIKTWSGFVTAIGTIKRLCGYGYKEIYAHATDALDSDSSAGFNSNAFEHELEKVRVILKDSNNERKIEEWEKTLYDYFKGNLRIPMNGLVLKDGSIADVNKIQNRVDQLKKMMIDEELKTGTNDGDFIRALLSEEGEYYLEEKDKGNYFLYGWDNDKEVNYAAYARKAESRNLKVFTSVLDKLISGKKYGDIICENGKNNIDRWRKIIIYNPVLFRSFDNHPTEEGVELVSFFYPLRTLKVVEQSSNVFLFPLPKEKHQLNALHKEFYSYISFVMSRLDKKKAVYHHAADIKPGPYYQIGDKKFFEVNYDDQNNYKVEQTVVTV